MDTLRGERQNLSLRMGQCRFTGSWTIPLQPSRRMSRITTSAVLTSPQDDASEGSGIVDRTWALGSLSTLLAKQPLTPVPTAPERRNSSRSSKCKVVTQFDSPTQNINYSLTM